MKIRPGLKGPRRIEIDDGKNRCPSFAGDIERMAPEDCDSRESRGLEEMGSSADGR